MVETHPPAVPHMFYPSVRKKGAQALIPLCGRRYVVRSQPSKQNQFNLTVGIHLSESSKARQV